MFLCRQTQLTHSSYLPLCSYLLTLESCPEESSCFKDRVGGLSYSCLSLLEAFCFPDAFTVVQVPSRSSWPKLVPCWDRVPPRSTTTSSSFLCWTRIVANTEQTHINIIHITQEYKSHTVSYPSCIWNMKQHIFKFTNASWTEHETKYLSTWGYLTVEGIMNKHIIQLNTMAATANNCMYHLEEERVSS